MLLVPSISSPLSVPGAKEVGYQGAMQAVPGEEPMFARVRMISPVEMDYAFVFAAWRDKDDHVKMDQWKRWGLKPRKIIQTAFNCFMLSSLLSPT